MSAVKAVVVLLIATGVVCALRYLGWLPGSRTRTSAVAAGEPPASRIAGPEPDTTAGRPPALTPAWVDAAAPDGSP